METTSEVLNDIGFLIFIMVLVKHSRLDVKEWLQSVKYRNLVWLWLGAWFLSLVFGIAAK